MPEFRLPLNSTESHEWFDALPDIARGYVEAAFFCGVQFGGEDGEPCEIDGLGPANLDREDRESLVADALRFWIENAETLDAAENGSPVCPNCGADREKDPDGVRRYCPGCGEEREPESYDLAQAGRDFWFSRNGHGVGFWSREEIPEAERDALDAAARAAGEVDLFPVPLDVETGAPLPGFHVDHDAPASPGAEPDPEDPDAWRVFLAMPGVPLSEIERAAVRALEAGAEPGTVRGEIERGARALEAIRDADIESPVAYLAGLERQLAGALEALEALSGGSGDRPALSDVSSARGAPMGRCGGALEPGEPLAVYPVTLDPGGYDSGGAYWGLGAPLWRVIGERSGGVRYVRAGSRAQAVREAVQ